MECACYPKATVRSKRVPTATATAAAAAVGGNGGVGGCSVAAECWCLAVLLLQLPEALLEVPQELHLQGCNTEGAFFVDLLWYLLKHKLEFKLKHKLEGALLEVPQELHLHTM
jgi:hypothetical protein